MKIDFLNQTSENDLDCVGHVLINLLADPDYHTFIGVSAFASSAGVNGVVSNLNKEKEHIKEITIIVGIDQKGTSKEALESLLNSGIESFVFYQKENPIFHPKVYFMEGNNKTDILIGSSNLTTQGLFVNSEASVHIKLDNGDQSDNKVIDDFKLKFGSLLKKDDPNMQPLTEKLIELLVEEGIVPDENERRNIFQKKTFSIAGKRNKDFDDIFPKRKIKQAPKEFKSQRQSQTNTVLPQNSNSIEITSTDDELWISKPLTERDLNIPTGTNTNQTGSMFFSKGSMKDIDQKHYFRDVVFANQSWQHDTKERTAHYERAFIDFTIVIDGTDKGTYKLKVSHDTRTNSPSYKQNNSMTSVSWGEAKDIIKDPKLLGKKAYLYKKGKGYLLKIE